MARHDSEVLSALLDRALSLPSDARAAFLNDECRNDQPLHEELSSLLAAHDASCGFFERLTEQIVNPALLALSDHAGDGLDVGQTLAHYRILEKLGTGGMGVVFKALDQRLDRFVALKLLPAPLSTDAASKALLLAEAKAASALDHPNIGIVHHIGETKSGRLFIVMGYYDGETLERQNQSGRRSVHEAIGLTKQIASALAAAHRKGIVHRDVKPSNIVITRDGTAKLLDFGIAVLAGSTPIAERAVVGTVAYMSPEQTHGVVDQRTDVWSLGVLLYEMVNGQRPFAADHELALIDAIRHDDWVPVDKVTSKTPAAVARILERCLAKDPDDRYGDAGQLFRDLESLDTAILLPSDRAATRGPRWRSLRFQSAVAALVAIVAGVLYVQREMAPLARTVGVETRVNRLAVLPVALLDTDANGGYPGDGLTDELIAQLSRIGGLRVVARSSVMGYKHGNKSAAEIGRELAVETVLRGTVHNAGDQLQISWQLIDARTQEQLWAKNYAAAAADLQHVQRDVAVRVADALNVEFPHPEQRLWSTAGTSSADAYLLYLKGLHFLEKRNDAAARQAKDYFEQALDLDPAFARAWVGLGNAYSSLSALGAMRTDDAYPRTRAAAERALQIDPELPEAHTTLAMALSSHYWEFEAAAMHYRRALELNPSDAHAHRLYAEYLRFSGRFDEALVEARRGEELDPLSPAHQIEAGISHYWARRYDEAIARFRVILDVNPRFSYAKFFLALALIQKHEYGEALATLNDPSAGGSLQQETLRGYIHGITGRYEEAQQVLDRLHVPSRTQNVSPWHAAVIHLGLGEHDRALALMEQSYQHRDWQVRMLPVEPMFDSLRSHPRFRALLEKVQ
jgi:serine/threonine-protein kinase